MNTNIQIFNQEVIPVYKTEEGEPVVIGRELHEKLGIKKKYIDWFKYMIDYGFKENIDFCVFPKNGKNPGDNGRPKIDHLLTFDMAKHIAMVQRSEAGYKIRQKLIDLEKKVQTGLMTFNGKWVDSPAALARAWADQYDESQRLTLETQELTNKVALLEQKVSSLKTKADLWDKYMHNGKSMSTTEIAKRYGLTASQLNNALQNMGIQHKSGEMWVLNEPYTNQGYMETSKKRMYDYNGHQTVVKYNRWTARGVAFVDDLLKSKGIEFSPNPPTETKQIEQNLSFKGGQGRRRPVKCLTTGVVYESVTAACRAIDRSTPALTCSIKNGGLCAGMRWAYADMLAA